MCLTYYAHDTHAFPYWIPLTLLALNNWHTVEKARRCSYCLVLNKDSWMYLGHFSAQMLVGEFNQTAQGQRYERWKCLILHSNWLPVDFTAHQLPRLDNKTICSHIFVRITSALSDHNTVTHPILLSFKIWEGSWITPPYYVTNAIHGSCFIWVKMALSGSIEVGFLVLRLLIPCLCSEKVQGSL